MTLGRHRLRARILVPIGVAFAVLIAAHIVGVNVTQLSQLQARLDHEVWSVEEEFAHREESDANLLLSTLSAISVNPRLQKAFIERDRTVLLELAKPLFEDLKVNHDITHLYFNAPDRTNFLRVHRPELHSDRIERYTTLQAAKSGMPIVGLDLGRFRALLTLRAVAPWYVNEELIGYIELGKEIAGMTERLATFEDADLLIVLDKQRIERNYWEAGMLALGRTPDWNRFPDWVIIETTMDPVPAGLESFFGDRSSFYNEDPVRPRIEHADSEKRYMSHLISIDDAAGRTVGQLAVVIDTTDEYADAYSPIWILAATTVGIGLVLFGLFFPYLGDVESSINERDLLEVQLRQSRRGESIGQLAGGIAHSFNNVLSAIKGFTELALLDIDSRDKVVDHLHRVEAASDNAADLVDGLLKYSREHPMKLVVLDLNALIERFLSMLERIIGENVTLAFVPDNHLGRVRSDPAMLEQVLLELIINARDAMPGGGELTVRTRRVTLDEGSQAEGEDALRGEYASITVSDTGRGIPENILPTIFEPFVTTKAIGQGTGLGLSIAKSIVQQLGGGISAESTPNKGARFVLHLPTTDEPLVDHTVESDVELRSGKGERVLVVENDSDIRQIVVSQLERLGYQVSSAADAVEAKVIVARLGDFDILVTDIVMRGSSGVQLARRMRNDNSRLKVVYITGHPHTERTFVINDDTTRLLTKPFSLNDLARSMRSLLDETPSPVQQNIASEV